MKHLLNGLAVVSLLAVAAPVVAQEASPRVPRAERMMPTVSQAQFIDGYVSKLRAADTNGDGQVTGAERRAYAGARRAERATAHFDRLDLNRDGQITREEMAAVYERRASDRAGHRRASSENRVVELAALEQHAREQFTRLDTDRDGQLTAQERRAGAEASGNERREQRRMRRAPQASPSPAVSE